MIIMKKLSLFAIIMIMIVAACNKDDDVIKKSSDDNDGYVPELRVRQFDANGEYDSETVTSRCQGLNTLSNQGNGSSITIGEFSLRGQQCWGNCDGGDPTSSSLSNGEFMLTDSKGDRIFISYSDGCNENDLRCNNPIGDYGCAVYSGYYTVTGGTGEYISAGGEGTLSITQYLSDGDLKSAEANLAAVTGGFSMFELNGSLTIPMETRTGNDL
jgi:hypothetical protein